MKIVNTSMESFLQYIEDKAVYIYGLGDVFQHFYKKKIYKKLLRSIRGYIDNGKAGEEIVIYGEKHLIKDTAYLKEVGGGIILLCSTKRIDDMYQDLCRHNLADDMECYVLPFIWAVSDGEDDCLIKKMILENTQPDKIEKIIHCFWFSGDEKPLEYQKCIESWKCVCPEYEIIEWNAENYNCEKNVFVKQAFQNRKWAFVSDYARLDVVYEYGGIYLDMDVELIKDFAPLLKFSAFFNYGTQHDIDLGSGFGSVRHNPFLKSLLDLYRDKEFCDDEGVPMIQRFVQPEYIRDTFADKGFYMNGNMQMKDDMLLLPRRYYTPIDDFTLQNHIQTEDTRGIHHYNAGWCTEDFHAQRNIGAFWREILKGSNPVR